MIQDENPIIMQENNQVKEKNDSNKRMIEKIAVDKVIG